MDTINIMTNHAAEIAITGLVIAMLKMENPEHILLAWCTKSYLF
jgi:hypothetical protein